MQGSKESLNLDEISYLVPNQTVQAETDSWICQGVKLDVRHSFHLSNPDVFTVDQKGKITALQERYSILTIDVELSDQEKQTWSESFPNEAVEDSIRFKEIGIYVSDKPFIYRLYNPNSGEHFYTHSQTERRSLIRAGWKAEGQGWNGYSSQDEESSPGYRLYNPNVGDHHYATAVNEKEDLIKYGWKDEGISFYASSKGSAPVYR